MDTDFEEFDFLCKWCGREVVLVVERISVSDPSKRIEKWLHRERGVTCLDESGQALSPAREAAPTRWKVALG
jgi:hypothetical protein